MNDFIKTVFAKVIAGLFVAILSIGVTSTVAFLKQISSDLNEIKTHFAVTLERVKNHEKRIEVLERRYRNQP